MTLSLEELGPAVESATHQGPVDTATAAAAAAAQPIASLGASVSPPQPNGIQAGSVNAEAAVAASDALKAQSGDFGIKYKYLRCTCSVCWRISLAACIP